MDRTSLQFKVGKEIYSVSLLHSVNTIAEEGPKQDPLDKAIGKVLEELVQPSIKEDAHTSPRRQNWAVISSSVRRRNRNLPSLN